MSTTMIRNTIKALALIAITMLMVIAISSINVSYQQQQQHHEQISARVAEEDNNNNNDDNVLLLPSKRVSRFLSENNDDDFQLHGRSLKPADHCHKDYEVCDIRYGNNYTCCGNKCFDLTTDKKHCGGCHSKCKFTHECCNGKCIDKTYDKRHCGSCNNKCLAGQYCVYGMCDYA
ncbi:stigma-specific STIG1-like protein 3 [Spinacia oleracea]|uniref:Stigma-specific STIG1-like protein 3 n=1 Tax=Spinacia oleracea TaxID=3562 RepID=A0A9R0INL8_SPIOL|nr:stigma-specific STIG1-like protein 3 [Spinacia oleracea]